MPAHRHTLVFGLLITLLAGSANAARPFATEDAGVLAGGECEVEAYVAHASARGSASESGWWLQPGCGLGPLLGRDAQLGLGASLVLSLPASGGAWHANLGHARGGGASATTWALAREQSFFEGLDGGIELYGDDHAAPWVGGGLRWAATARLTLDASAAWQADGQSARALSVGMKIAW